MMSKQKILILFLFILILASLYAIFINQNKLTPENDKYYETFGESCFDRITDDYLMSVCEKIKDNAKRDNCYYNKSISSGYDRVCHLVKNETLRQKCLKDVGIIISNNESLRQRAEKYNPNKRKI